MGPLLTVQFPAYDDMHTISLNEKLSGPPQFWTRERQIKQMPYQKNPTERRFRHLSWTQDWRLSNFGWKYFRVEIIFCFSFNIGWIQAAFNFKIGSNRERARACHFSGAQDKTFLQLDRETVSGRAQTFALAKHKAPGYIWWSPPLKGYKPEMLKSIF